MADAVKELVFKVVAQVAGAKNALKDVEKTAKQTQKNLKNIEESSKKTSFGIEKLISGFKGFASALALTAGAFALFRTAQQKAQETLSRRNFASQYGIASKEVKTLELAYKSMGYEASQAQASLASVQDQISKSISGQGTSKLVNLMYRAGVDVRDGNISPIEKLKQAVDYLLRQNAGDKERTRRDLTNIYGLDRVTSDAFLRDGFANTLANARKQAEELDRVDPKLQKISEAMDRVNKASDRLSTALASTLAPAFASAMEMSADFADMVATSINRMSNFAPEAYDDASALDQLTGELQDCANWLASLAKDTDEAGQEFQQLSEGIQDGIQQFSELDGVKPILSGFKTFFSEIVRGCKDVWEEFTDSWLSGIRKIWANQYKFVKPDGSVEMPKPTSTTPPVPSGGGGSISPSGILNDREQALSDLIHRAESSNDKAGGGYNAFNYNAGVNSKGQKYYKSGVGDLTNMTIKDIFDAQRSGKLFAVGRYQFTNNGGVGTLNRLVNRLGLDINTTKFDAKTQDMLFQALIAENKNAYNFTRNGGQWSKLAHLFTAQQWRGIADPRTGKTYGDKDANVNKSSVTPQQVYDALNKFAGSTGYRTVGNGDIIILNAEIKSNDPNELGEKMRILQAQTGHRQKGIDSINRTKKLNRVTVA